MVQQIYVNLPVSSVKSSMKFFSDLGFEFNMQFTDEKAACLVLGENIHAMLLHKDFFKTFTTKQVADATKVTEVLTCISLATRKAVDEMVVKAKAGGGVIFRESQDHGFMYQHAFEDLDGHIWELVSYEEKK